MNTLPSKRYLNGKPTSKSWKASVCMNITMNSVGACTSCLTSFVTGNGWEYSLPFWTCASMPSCYCRTTAMNLAGLPNFAIYKAHHDWLFQIICKVVKGHAEVHILFLTFSFSSLAAKIMSIIHLTFMYSQRPSVVDQDQDIHSSDSAGFLPASSQQLII